jgi:acetyl esterase
MASLSLSERLERTLLRTLLEQPPARLVKWSGKPAVIVDGQGLDPQIQLALTLRRRMGKAGLVSQSVPRARAALARDMRINALDVPVGRVRDLTIDGAAGPLRARHYAPKGPKGAPLLVFLHGGGFVVGDLETHDVPCRLLCRHAEMHVLSVDYRLAPEHPFPAAIEDAVAAVRWAAREAAELGADPSRLCLGGDSAGANLTLVTTMLHRDLPVAAQLVIYPPTDAVNDFPSHALFGTDYFLSVTDRETFTRLYLEGTGTERGNPRVSPLLGDLRELPPSLIVVAGFDILRDEAEAFATAMRDAGNDIQLQREPSLPHGFVNMTGFCTAAREATIALAREWKTFLLATPVRTRETHT